MVRLLIAYVAGLAVMCTLDFLWLGMMVPRVYRPVLAPIVADAPRLAPAVAFYLLYFAGLMWFAVRPALASGGGRAALANGALFGLVAYATYDLTNQATLRIWSLKITVIDIAWGVLVSGAAAAVSFAVAAWGRRAGG